MLNLFRKGGVAQAVVGAVALTIMIVFALEFRPGRGAVGRLTEDCAVKVYDRCISQKEFFAAYGLIVPYGTSPKAIKQLGLRRQILDGLTERELLNAEAERLGIGISDDAVEEELTTGRFHVSVPAASRTLSRSLYLCKVDPMTDQCEAGSEMVRYVPDVKSAETGEFDYKKYERIVRNIANRGPREFRAMQQRELLARRMRNLIQARVRVSIDEARLQFERERSKATVRTVSVNRDWFARYLVDVNEQAIDAWTLANKPQIDAAWETEKPQFTADCPLVSEIYLPLAEDASDADKAEVRKKLEQAAKRVKDGAPFESVARQTSAGASATSGGYLGCLNESYGPGAADLLKSLGALKPGENSGIVETSDGLHLLQFHGKLRKEDIETTGRRAVARRLYLRAKADELAKDFATRLIERVKQGAKLEQATRDLGNEAFPKSGAGGTLLRDLALSDESRPKMEISAPFTMLASPIPDALPTEAPASKAFALDKPEAVYAEPLATERGFAVMQLKEKELVKPEQFEKERGPIVRSLQHAKAGDALVRYVAELRKAAGSKIKYDGRLLDDAQTKVPSGDS
jgi:peptidyl-prolyl cis-trans isomerase D